MVVTTGLSTTPLPAVVHACALSPLVIAPVMALAFAAEFLVRRWRSRRDARAAERCWALPPFVAGPPAGDVARERP